MSTEGQKRQARQNVTRYAETKAQLRAIRSILGIDQLYSDEDINKPFVVITAVPALDLDDPIQRNLAAAHAIDAVSKLYHKPETRALPSGGGEDTERPLDVTPDGEVIRLTDEERARRIEDTKQGIRDNCKE